MMQLLMVLGLMPSIKKKLLVFFENMGKRRCSVFIKQLQVLFLIVLDSIFISVIKYCINRGSGTPIGTQLKNKSLMGSKIDFSSTLYHTIHTNTNTHTRTHIHATTTLK